MRFFTKTFWFPTSDSNESDRNIRAGENALTREKNRVLANDFASKTSAWR